MKRKLVVFAVAAVLAGVVGADISSAAVRGSSDKSNLVRNKPKGYYTGRGREHKEQAKIIVNEMEQAYEKGNTKEVSKLLKRLKEEVVKPLGEISKDLPNREGDDLRSQIRLLQSNFDNFTRHIKTGHPPRDNFWLVMSEMRKAYPIVEKLAHPEEPSEKQLKFTLDSLEKQSASIIKPPGYYIKKGEYHVGGANLLEDMIDDLYFDIPRSRQTDLLKHEKESFCDLQDCYRREVIKPLEELSASFNNEVVNVQVEFLRKNVNAYIDWTNTGGYVTDRIAAAEGRNRVNYHSSVTNKMSEIYKMLEELSQKPEIKEQEKQTKPELTPSHVETPNPYLGLPLSDILEDLKNASRSIRKHAKKLEKQPGSDETPKLLELIARLTQTATQAYTALQTRKTTTP